MAEVGEALVLHIDKAYGLSLSEPVASGTGEHHGLVVHLDHLNRLANALRNRVDKSQGGEVEPSVADRLEELDRAALVQVDVDARVLRGKALQAFGDLDVKGFAGTDADSSGEESGHGADSGACRRGCGQGLARLGKKRAPRIGQLHPASGAYEEGRAKLALERAHRGRDRGLGEVEPLRGAREMSLLSDGYEVRELPEVDASSLPIESSD
jgi:hypothetical protein